MQDLARTSRRGQQVQVIGWLPVRPAVSIRMAVMPEESSMPTDSPEAPDFAKGVIWAWHHIRQNWEALMRLPVVIALVAVGVAAYFSGASRSSEELSVKNERIAFLNDQIAAYKDRLQGASPDQAAKQFAILQN